MAEDPLVSLDEAMKELQIDQEELKKLFRKNDLRYVLEDGKIKIPRMALMALKIERMTSTTQQFTRIKRAKREKGPTQALPQMSEGNLISMDEAIKILETEETEIKELIALKRLRYEEIEGQCKLYRTSVQALKIQGVRQTSPKLCKKRPVVKRVY